MGAVHPGWSMYDELTESAGGEWLVDRRCVLEDEVEVAPFATAVEKGTVGGQDVVDIAVVLIGLNIVLVDSLVVVIVAIVRHNGPR